MSLLVFFSRRFTSFRFAWGFFSLFFSMGTFAIVLTDRFGGIDLFTALFLCAVLFLVSSIIFDALGIRAAINKSESWSNPQTVEIIADIKEIKQKLTEVKK